VGKALSQVVLATESQSSNSTKEYLDPRDHRHSLSNNSMTDHCNLSNLSVEPLGDMKLEVYPEHDLDK
jgi:hypothetical protein